MSYDFVNAPRRALAKIEIQGSTVWGGISSYNRDLTFTEVASGETDSLDIKLHDCDNHWLNDWLIDKGTRLLARIELENWDKSNRLSDRSCNSFYINPREWHKKYEEVGESFSQCHSTRYMQ